MKQETDMITMDRWMDDPTGAVMEIAAGNIGAVDVAVKLYNYRFAEDARGVVALICADASGITGSKLWVAYKDRCGGNLPELVERLIKRDETLKGE